MRNQQCSMHFGSHTCAQQRQATKVFFRFEKTKWSANDHWSPIDIQQHCSRYFGRSPFVPRVWKMSRIEIERKEVKEQLTGLGPIFVFVALFKPRNDAYRTNERPSFFFLTFPGEWVQIDARNVNMLITREEINVAPPLIHLIRQSKKGLTHIAVFNMYPALAR